MIELPIIHISASLRQKLVLIFMVDISHMTHINLQTKLELSAPCHEDVHGNKDIALFFYEFRYEIEVDVSFMLRLCYPGENFSGNIRWYKYYVFGHYPSSLLYPKTPSCLFFKKQRSGD
jgi:hypothetical protein